MSNKSATKFTISQNGKEIYTLPESRSPDIQSVFFMSVHKSGSTLLSNMVRAMSEMLDYELVDIQSHYFNTGVPDRTIPAETKNIFLPKGYIYSGFRYLPYQYKIDCLKECPLIVLVRDPRDAVVSQYFSLSKSHPMPGTKNGEELLKHMKKERAKTALMDINEFALREIGTFVKKLDDYSGLLATHPKSRLFQYEEVIYMKKKWILQIINFLNWKLKGGQPMNLANRFNVIPAAEDPSKHIRQVHPQNYLAKLSPETIQEINKTYQKTLLRYNYV